MAFLGVLLATSTTERPALISLGRRALVGLLGFMLVDAGGFGDLNSVLG